MKNLISEIIASIGNISLDQIIELDLFSDYFLDQGDIIPNTYEIYIEILLYKGKEVNFKKLEKRKLSEWFFNYHLTEFLGNDVKIQINLLKINRFSPEYLDYLITSKFVYDDNYTYLYITRYQKLNESFIRKYWDNLPRLCKFNILNKNKIPGDLIEDYINKYSIDTYITSNIHKFNDRETTALQDILMSRKSLYYVFKHLTVKNYINIFNYGYTLTDDSLEKNFNVLKRYIRYYPYLSEFFIEKHCTDIQGLKYIPLLNKVISFEFFNKGVQNHWWSFSNLGRHINVPENVLKDLLKDKDKKYKVFQRKLTDSFILENTKYFTKDDIIIIIKHQSLNLTTIKTLLKIYSVNNNIKKEILKYLIKYQKLDMDFIKYYIPKNIFDQNSNLIIRYQKLDIDFIENNLESLNSYLIGKFQRFNEDFMYRNLYRLNLHAIPVYQTYSESFVLRTVSKINWSNYIDILSKKGFSRKFILKLMNNYYL